MKYLRLLLIVVVVLGVASGCRKRVEVVEDDPSPPAVALYEYGLIDSYGVDSELYPEEPLTVDPYVDEGLFEVYWEATANKHYTFYLSVGDTRDIDDSDVVYSESCGPGRSCGRTGYAICAYSTDFYVSCDSEDWADIAHFFDQVPERLYVFAEVCDTFTCNYDRRAVYFE